MNLQETAERLLAASRRGEIRWCEPIGGSWKTTIGNVPVSVTTPGSLSLNSGPEWVSVREPEALSSLVQHLEREVSPSIRRDVIEAVVSNLQGAPLVPETDLTIEVMLERVLESSHNGRVQWQRMECFLGIHPEWSASIGPVTLNFVTGLVLRIRYDGTTLEVRNRDLLKELANYVDNHLVADLIQNNLDQINHYLDVGASEGQASPI